jgi:hypothetical protein
MDIIKKDEWDRDDVLQLIEVDNAIGIELGVAKGGYSKRMVESKKFAKFFGVDRYSDIHDTEEYKQALKNVGLFSNYSLLRMRFDEALNLFEDDTFDFIYIDGYAHSGQLGGETIFDWYPKLKEGGVLSGDDYDEEAWPLVVAAVKEIATQLDATVYITSVKKSDTYSNYASWAIVKKGTVKLTYPKSSIKRAKIIDSYVSYKRNLIAIVVRVLPNNFKRIIKRLLSK